MTKSEGVPDGHGNLLLLIQVPTSSLLVLILSGTTLLVQIYSPENLHMYVFQVLLFNNQHSSVLNYSNYYLNT